MPNSLRSKVGYIITMCREIELRENLVGDGFMNPPDEKAEYNNRVTVMGTLIRMTIIGEIVSTTGFDAEK